MSKVSTFVRLIASFNRVLTKPTAENLAVLARGAVLSPKARTVAACLRAAWPWVKKGWQAYGNVLRRSKISPLALARILFGLLLRVVPEKAPICLAIDETLVRRWGPYVPGLGMHRDAVRSSQRRTVISPGHKWVVLSVVVWFSFMDGPIALPLLMALYTSPKPPKRNCREPLYRRHRTVPQLALVLVSMVARWAPQRRFIVIGDGSYATHSLAKHLRAKSPAASLRNTSLVSRFYFEAAIYDRPAPYCGRGRPRQKGQQLPSPQQIIEALAPEDWREREIQWYGGRREKVLLCSGTGQWYKSGLGAKWIRWVVVRGPDESDQDEIFFTTDRMLTPAQIVETFVLRWSIEKTFQEAREFLGLETLRNWSKKSIERSVPLLLGLYSVIVVWFYENVDDPESFRCQWPWYEKPHVTFSDMLMAARRDILGEMFFNRPAETPCGHLIWASDLPFPPRNPPDKEKAA